jgi:hypothetical protein
MIMSDDLSGLIVSLVAGALVLGIALAIRIRGPQGLLKSIDWNRVSDPDGLGQFASLIVALMGATIAAHGILLFALHGSPSLRNMSSVAFVVVLSVLAIVLLIGQLRYQDKPRSRQFDERR